MASSSSEVPEKASSQGGVLDYVIIGSGLILGLGLVLMAVDTIRMLLAERDPVPLSVVPEAESDGG
jgi:hypothetical protein